jgi:hypothetical protein
MPLEQIQKIATSEVVFAILFIAFLVWYLKKSSDDSKAQREADQLRDKEQREANQLRDKEQREADQARDAYMMTLHKEREDALKLMLMEQRADSLAREADLSTNVRRMVDQQERIGDTLKEVSGGLIDLEKKVDNNIMEIWKVMAQAHPPQVTIQK